MGLNVAVKLIILLAEAAGRPFLIVTGIHKPDALQKPEVSWVLILFLTGGQPRTQFVFVWDVARWPFTGCTAMYSDLIESLFVLTC